MILLFIAGLFIGSFLNVVILRYRLGGKILSLRGLSGRSHCPACKKTLSWTELVPLFSFLIQSRRCRSCSALISWHYPAVELITAIITAWIPAVLMSRYGGAFLNSFDYAIFFAYCGVWLLFSYTLIVASAIDFKHQILPDQANLLIALLGGANQALLWGFGDRLFPGRSFLGAPAIIFSAQSQWLNLAIAIAFVFLLYGGIIFSSRGRGMGLGDLKLALALAILVGWPDIVFLSAGAFIFGAIYGLFLIFAKLKSGRDSVPFGPFLAISVFFLILYGEKFAAWYFRIT